MSLRSKKNITICRAIPAFIPRKLALDLLHDHAEIITLNPLVLSHRQISPPPDAPSDEARSIWYEITERIQFIPGIGKAGSSTISFNGVFHDVRWGLQTHIYAPMGVDMRVQYRIDGSQPGVEAAAPLELGLERLGAPKEGLYLRADMEFKCNIALASFVKSTSVAAVGEMVGKMVKKAEQMDADILQNLIREERSDNISRTQSKEAVPWQGPDLAQVQTYPQNGDHAPSGWPLSQSRSEESDSHSPSVDAHRTPRQENRQQDQQQPYPGGQPGNVAHAYPTIVAELDGGYCSARAEPGEWSHPTFPSDNYSYPRVGKSPPRSRSRSREPGRDYEQGLNSQQPQQTQYHEYSVQPLFSTQRFYQPAPDHPRVNVYQEQQQHQQQQPQVPQFQSERKYSFDENRLQPEILNNGTDGRRWSAQFTRA